MIVTHCSYKSRHHVTRLDFSTFCKAVVKWRPWLLSKSISRDGWFFWLETENKHQQKTLQIAPMWLHDGPNGKPDANCPKYDHVTVGEVCNLKNSNKQLGVDLKGLVISQGLPIWEILMYLKTYMSSYIGSEKTSFTVLSMWIAMFAIYIFVLIQILGKLVN